MSQVSAESHSSREEICVRPLTDGDLSTFLALVDQLADYEQLPPPDDDARERLAADALSRPSRINVLLAERQRRVVGYAVFFETYSTFLARPTLFVEDVFVLPEERRSGVGRAFMRALAQEAIRRGCGRMEWQVLTWNAPAISFYERCRARRLDEWYTYRLTKDQFAALAKDTPESLTAE